MAIASRTTRSTTPARRLPSTKDVRAKGPKVPTPVKGGIAVTRAVTIRKPAAELYGFWRRLENLSQVIKHPVTITSLSDRESHWSVSAPAGKRVEWDAEILQDEPDRLIAWRSKPGAEVENSGSVRFDPAPGDEGTEVMVSLEYSPPGGKLGAAIAKLTRDSAGAQVGDALRRFKALMEAGEIPTIEGQSVGGPQAPRKGKK